MGMPIFSISFRESGENVTERNNRGILMLLLRGAVPAKNPVEVTEIGDIPSSVSAENKNYIKMALAGNETTPKKVVCYFLAKDAEIDEALNYAQSHQADWLTMPTAETDGVVDTIKDWVIKQKEFGNDIKAVLPNCAADSEHIVNFTTAEVMTENGTYNAEQFCVRIAGIICSTELTHSITYVSIPEATDCTRLSVSDMDTAVNKGELIAFWDGEKVKLSRGVNSLVTLSADKGKQFQKIKIAEAMTIIKRDLKKLCEDNYIGKFANNYSNRCLLLSAVQDYFDGMILDGVISSYDVSFDTTAIKVAMKTAGISYSDMSDEDIAEYDFGSSVYLKCSAKMLDAIEDITISIEV
ncbi:MAG: phage tail sheath subtilisin-like domain-containing protein [Faecalibacterium sp.]|nr:phage tail sheath subtilisin-like domain-containing protein [Ruminococcus sp.]MCM1392105.1 phage tail sheath subtilisin-like domain-containing protein [Ruminococcus sp.]MCM1485802.1 phage tail sheath subtilisin-like domain-containing protein [Faecalibacterium sp.]